MMATAAKKQERPNEDLAGYKGSTFWLMDGATQLERTHEFDAAWLVRALDQEFQMTLTQNPEYPLVDLAKDAIKTTADLFYRKTGIRPDDEAGQRPACTLIMGRPHADHLDYLVLCDSTLAVCGSRGTQVLTDDRIDQNISIEPVYDCLREGYGFETQAFKDAMVELYARTKPLMNTPEGFYSIQQDPAVIEQALTGSLPFDAATDHILAMSDGFTRAYDILNLYPDVPALWQDILTVGPEEIIRRIRMAEQQDGQGKNFPRSSLHDDATILWGVSENF